MNSQPFNFDFIQDIIILSHFCISYIIIYIPGLKPKYIVLVHSEYKNFP